MKKVVIYSTPTCTFCKAAKDFFTENRVEYQDIDVSVDEAARNEMVEKSGQMGVPVIVIGEEMTVGFDEAKVKELLGM